MPTKKSLAKELAIEAGETFDDVDVAAQYEDWVQEAVDEVYSFVPWFLSNAVDPVTTTASVAEYTLAATTARIRNAVISAAPAGDSSALNAPISYAPVERLIARSISLSATGRPKYWYYSGVDANTQLKIQLQPVPSDVYTIDFHVGKRPAALGSDDTIPFPPEFIKAIRDKVRSLSRFNDNEGEAAAFMQQSFESQVLRLVENFHGEARGRSRMRVKGSKAEYQSPSSPGGD